MSTGTGTAVGHIHWHDLMTNDVDKARSFYTELLGWGTELWKPGEMDYPMIMVGNEAHGGFHPLQGPAAEAPPHWIAYVIVESADEASKRAEAAGGSVYVPPTDIPEVGRFSVLAYPETAVIAAFEPAGDPPTGTGTFLWDELMADDVEAAKAFYGDVFGWTADTMDMGTMDMGTGQYTIFKADDEMVAGLMNRPDNVLVQGWMSYVHADDVDTSVARVGELGGAVHAPPFDIPTVGRIAVIADPTGAAVGMMTPASQPS